MSAVEPATTPPASDPPAPGQRSRATTFIIANLVAIGGMLAIFYLVMFGEFLNRPFHGTLNWFLRHETLMVLAASTPFFASLLVGWASSKKARRRRELEAQLALEAEARA